MKVAWSKTYDSRTMVEEDFQMFMVPQGIGSIAYISNYTYWKRVHEEGTILDRLIDGISHETLHHVVKKHSSKRACKRLDRLTRPVGGLITHSGLPDHCCLDEIERYFRINKSKMNGLTKN
jgi:hypothetical protein